MTEVAEPVYRKRISYQAILLGGFATLAAALLIVGNNATRDDIGRRHADDLLQSLAQVLPDALHDNNLLDSTVVVDDAQGKPLTVYRATKDHRPTGFAWITKGQGYGGEIALILAVDPTGELLGVRVLSHSETPGLGDRIEAQKSQWILRFTGRSLQNTPESEWAVKKDGGRFDQFSGATITPRGVVKAVHEGLLFFQTHRSEIAATADAGNASHSSDEVTQ